MPTAATDHRRSLTLAATAAAALLIGSLGTLAVMAPTPQPRGAGIGGPFTLIGGHGQTITNRDFPNKYLLIYFGYTSCRDTCPATLTTVSAALDQLGAKADHVQPLFITIDPQRDTPEIVQRYAANFSPRLIGLTGTPAELRKVATEYSVTSILHGTAGAPAYDLDHSAVLYLMAPGGAFVAPVRADLAPPEMSKAIAAHLS
jgi:protein SCO1/2